MAFVVAAALGFVVFVTLANVVVMQFIRNATRAAVDEAVRVGSRSGDPAADCEARARAVLDGLLGPAAREGMSVRCTVVSDPPRLRARADVVMTPWLPALPAWSFTVSADATREEIP